MALSKKEGTRNGLSLLGCQRWLMFSDSLENHCPAGQHVVGWQHAVFQVVFHSLTFGHLGTLTIHLNEPLARQIIGGLVLLEETTFL